MEPDGRPPTPGTSYGTLDLHVQKLPPTSPVSMLQLSCSPNKHDGSTSAQCEQSEGPEPGGDDLWRASAFTSSLSWDSDSEKETLEEITELSNPHGLAAHSPASPSTGLRLECEDSQETEHERPASSHEEGPDGSSPNTDPQESRTSQLCANQATDSTLWNVSEPFEPLVSKSPPKEACQPAQEDNNTEGSRTHMGKECREQERDVYSFPGDSDPESPPPAPWAHCTFVQRCGRKRVLLRPFSGTSPGLERGSKDNERMQDFDKDVSLEEAKEQVEESVEEVDNQIFTCVECSIYFNKQIHLQEHMAEHSKSSSGGKEQDQAAESGQFKCTECGWNLPSITELQGHQKQHLESRETILKEIEKLKVDDFKKHDNEEALTVRSPVRSQNADCAIVDLDAAVVASPVQGRGQTGYRRRFICPVCNFSTRTPQALANHKKTHNRKPTSTQLACLYCAFRTTSKKGLRDHLKHHAHHGENGQNSKYVLNSEISMTGKFHRGVGALEDCTMPDGIASDMGLNKRGDTWVKMAGVNSSSEYDKLSDNEDEGQVQTTESNCQQEGESAQHTSSPSDMAQCSSARTLPLRRSLRNDEKPDEGKASQLRRSSRVSAGPVLVLSDDEEDAQRSLSELFIDEEEMYEDTEDLKSVERKCPYCPDRFHNGIGLANHVRGHLNRVGVSYNVRHFISPEEVNAIERRFSYQKKKKKVANFDPGTFSVMHCEFCNAGFDTRAGLSSHARAHLRDLGITNWDITISPIHVLREVFSSRPDLVIPTAPPRSLCDEEDEVDSEEDHDIIEVKLEEESRLEISDSSVPWKYEDQIKECKDEEDEVSVEEGDALQLAALSLVREADRSPQEDARTKDDYLKCEVCGAQFETRRGLSSHARSHLRQLGIRGSESSGAPIHFLYQIAKERNLDSQIRRLQKHTPAKDRSPSAPRAASDEVIEVMDVEKTPASPSLLAKAAKAVPPATSHSTPSPGASPLLAPSPSSVVRKAPISSLLPVSSPLRSLEYKVGGMRSLTSSLSTPPVSKPVWAPLDHDAPLNLTLEADRHKDIVCQLCGAWFETRKGLSSHARAHLRHFGVEYSESKGSPIDLLTQLIESDEFKHKARELQLEVPVDRQGLSRTLSSPKPPLLSLPTSSSPLLYKVTTSKTTSASPLLGPPAKRLKPASMQIFRLSSGEFMSLPLREPLKEIGCEFCGEYFENRKGLSSHARSHLRQMGITQWTVNGSPIDTLRELIARRGLPSALPLKPARNPSSPALPPRSPVSSASSPPSALLGRLPFAFAQRHSPPRMVSRLNSAPPAAPVSGLLKPKAEPVQVDVSGPRTVAPSVGTSSGSPVLVGSNSTHALNLAMSHEVEPTRDIRCEFCGEYFENRKGLSSHARSHLRQMGITQWSVNGSPIDTLREVMRKRGLTSASSLELEIKEESGETSSPDAASSYQSSSLHKSPHTLFQSGLRVHKAGLSSVGTSAILSEGRLFGMSTLGKRPLSEDSLSADLGLSALGHLKNYPPLPHDLSFKSMSPSVKHRPDPSCELCGFYFENRKALASHARAHLRQFGVTEWSVNGSPIETLSAWIRSRPQKVLDMHRSYMQGNCSALKKQKCRSPVSVSPDSPHVLPASSPRASASSSSSSSASQWSSSLAVSLVPPVNREVAHCPSKTSGDESSTNRNVTPPKPADSSPVLSRLPGSLPLPAQVARSEFNVRMLRGFERRPLKHPSGPEAAERDSPQRTSTGTVPALLPKPPSYPLVKLEGNFYTLKCRFCEVEFHGPLSVQEDWIRHIQQHIFKMNYKTPPPPRAPASSHTAPPPVAASVRTSASTSSSSHGPPLPAKCTPNTASELGHLSAEQLEPTPV